MKKFIIPIMFLLISCKKERTCTCTRSAEAYKKDATGTWAYNGSIKTIDIKSVEKSRKSQAKAICRDREWEEYSTDEQYKNEYKTSNCKLQ